MGTRGDQIQQKRTCGEEEQRDEGESGEPGRGLLQEDRQRAVRGECQGCWKVEPMGFHGGCVV